MTHARTSRCLAVLALLCPLACFGRRSSTAPPDPGPARTSCVQFWTQTGSPYLDDAIRTYVPRGIDDAAGFRAVGHDADLPLVFAFEVIRIGNVNTGYAVSGNTITSTGYVHLEYRATLTWRDGRILWSYEGWQDHRSVPHALHDAARSIRASLRREAVFAYEPVRAACTEPVPDDPPADAPSGTATAPATNGAPGASAAPAPLDGTMNRSLPEEATRPERPGVPPGPDTSNALDAAWDGDATAPKNTDPTSLEPKPWPGPW